MISQWIHRISDTQRPYRKWKIPSGNSKLRDQESFCKEDQRVVFGCLKKRWKDTGGILQCIYQKGFQKDRTDFWRLSLEHDQYKGYSSCQRKEGKFLSWYFTRSFRLQVKLAYKVKCRVWNRL